MYFPQETQNQKTTRYLWWSSSTALLLLTFTCGGLTRRGRGSRSSYGSRSNL